MIIVLVENARKQARRDAKEQDWEIKKVSEATQEDIEWVNGMGGYVPTLTDNNIKCPVFNEVKSCGKCMVCI